MQSVHPSQPALKREYTQLLRLQEHLLTQLQLIRNELMAPGTVTLLREMKALSGMEAPEAMSGVAAAVEEAIRALKTTESEVRRQLANEPVDLKLGGIVNLPARLARFLAERKDLPGFQYEIFQDRVRGWVIRWKEYTAEGTVRGSGQFYERPYAWLDE